MFKASVDITAESTVRSDPEPAGPTRRDGPNQIAHQPFGFAGGDESTIAQAQHIAELGALDPEKVVTPGIYVSRVVHVPYGEPTIT